MITLPGYDDAGRLAGDVAGQMLLEADARRQGMRIEREFVDRTLRYRFFVGVTGRAEERQVRVDFVPTHSNPAVHVDGPPCLRHRWKDDSLCMWDPQGPRSERWLIADGLPELGEHVRVHLHCEAQCRAGNPWPKEEMAGDTQENATARPAAGAAVDRDDQRSCRRRRNRSRRWAAGRSPGALRQRRPRRAHPPLRPLLQGQSGDLHLSGAVGRRWPSPHLCGIRGARRHRPSRRRERGARCLAGGADYRGRRDG